MTQEELKALIIDKKVKAFNAITIGLDIDPNIAGYKSHEQMALHIIQNTKQDIERATRAWEKDNPA